MTASSEPTDGLDSAAQYLVHEVPLRGRVLEIGCGTGTLSRELASKRGARVTAIDLAARMIDVARVRTNDRLGIEYRVADFMRLAPRGFDVAIAVDTIHYLPLAVAAERMAEAIELGGLVMIADRYRPWFRDGDVPSLRAIRKTLESVLPGVAVRRHMGWRYSAIWRKR